MVSSYFGIAVLPAEKSNSTVYFKKRSKTHVALNNNELTPARKLTYFQYKSFAQSIFYVSKCEDSSIRAPAVCREIWRSEVQLLSQLPSPLYTFRWWHCSRNCHFLSCYICEEPKMFFKFRESDEWTSFMSAETKIIAS